MKYFLIFLFPFFASAQVEISPDVARFFLERHEQVKLLEQETRLLRASLINLERQVQIKDGIISTYESDQTQYMKLVELMRTQINENELYIEQLRKEIKREKRRKRITTIAGGALIGIILLWQ